MGVRPSDGHFEQVPLFTLMCSQYWGLMHRGYWNIIGWLDSETFQISSNVEILLLHVR